MTSPSGELLSQGATYTVSLDYTRPYLIQVQNGEVGSFSGPSGQFEETSQGLPAIIVVTPTFGNQQTTTAQVLSRRGSQPVKGSTFTLTFTNQAGTAATTAAIPYNATAPVIQAALAALGNVGTTAGAVTVTGSGTVDKDPMTVSFNLPAGNNEEFPLVVNNGGMLPQPSYSVTKAALCVPHPVLFQLQHGPKPDQCGGAEATL